MTGIMWQQRLKALKASREEWIGMYRLCQARESKLKKENEGLKARNKELKAALVQTYAVCSGQHLTKSGLIAELSSAQKALGAK